MNPCDDFTYSPKLTVGVFFNERRYDMAVCFKSTFTISTQKSAQQFIRIRHNLSGTGLVAFSDTPNYFATCLLLDLYEISKLIDMKEHYGTNIFNVHGGLDIS